MKQHSQSERVWPARWSPFVAEPTHNRYRQPDKASTVSCCPVYGVAYLEGRWLWRSPPLGVTSLVCSAYQRATDQVSVVRIHLSGDFEAAHREETLIFARHREADLRTNHPMERIMAAESTSNGTDILMTGSCLARDTDHAIHHAFHGHLTLDHGNVETELHVKWSWQRRGGAPQRLRSPSRQTDHPRNGPSPAL